MSVGSVVPASSMMVAMLGGHYDLPALVAILRRARAWGSDDRFREWFDRDAHDHPVVDRHNRRHVCGDGADAWVCSPDQGVDQLCLMYPHPLTKSNDGHSSSISGFSVSIFWWLGFVGGLFLLPAHFSPIGNWMFAVGGDQGKRAQRRHSDAQRDRRPVHDIGFLLRVRRVSCPGDDLSTGTGCGRSVLYLQLDHVRGHRWRSADRGRRARSSASCWAP